MYCLRYAILELPFFVRIILINLDEVPICCNYMIFTYTYLSNDIEQAYYIEASVYAYILKDIIKL